MTTRFLAVAVLQAAWDDGCNAHEARLPLIAAPYTVLATPASPVLAYEDASTAVLCTGLPQLEPRRGS